MKKYSFFLIVLFSVFAFLKPGMQEEKIIPISSAVKNSLQSFSGSHNPEWQVNTFHSLSSAQANHGFQKLLGYLSFDEQRTAYAPGFLFFSDEFFSTSLVKDYLFHIYPSHNFW